MGWVAHPSSPPLWESLVYARVLDRTPVDGKPWYLPHYGVYHPAKPNKICVVFDCSAEDAGRSINKELLVGPDLIYYFIGSLIKFRQGKVAFVADIEKTFFQVLGSKEHRGLSHFLWWQDGNLSAKKLINHEICVHVFGGPSLPSCSNNVHKRTSIDGEDNFGRAVTEPLQNNFYVDDLLKSLDNEREAIKLKECQSSGCIKGFKLTKFLINIKQVLQSIDGADRR